MPWLRQGLAHAQLTVIIDIGLPASIKRMAGSSPSSPSGRCFVVVRAESPQQDISYDQVKNSPFDPETGGQLMQGFCKHISVSSGALYVPFTLQGWMSEYSLQKGFQALRSG